MSDNIKKFFRCDCGLEGIIVEKNLEDNEIYLECYVGSGFYTNQQPLKNFFKRFKIIWQVLIKGEYRFFEIVLNKDVANDLSEELKS